MSISLISFKMGPNIRAKLYYASSNNAFLVSIIQNQTISLELLQKQDSCFTSQKVRFTVTDPSSFTLCNTSWGNILGYFNPSQG